MPGSAPHRREFLCAGLAVGASMLLPQAARGHEIITTFMRVTHPWSRATAADASVAVLCMKFDEVSRTDRLVRVETPVAAGADMAGAGAGPTVDFVIPEGQETYLSEAATYVRFNGLKFPLLVGRSYPLLLGFEQGGVYNTTFSVDQAEL